MQPQTMNGGSIIIIIIIANLCHQMLFLHSAHSFPHMVDAILVVLESAHLIARVILFMLQENMLVLEVSLPGGMASDICLMPY